MTVVITPKYRNIYRMHAISGEIAETLESKKLRKIISEKFIHMLRLFWPNLACSLTRKRPLKRAKWSSGLPLQSGSIRQALSSLIKPP